MWGEKGRKKEKASHYSESGQLPRAQSKSWAQIFHELRCGLVPDSFTVGDVHSFTAPHDAELSRHKQQD